MVGYQKCSSEKEKLLTVCCISSLGLAAGEKSQDDEVTSSSTIQEEIQPCCPCEASLSMEAISAEEAETDREDLRVFSHKLSLLLRLLLGEKKMIQLGAPDVSSPDLLEKVLRLTGSKVVREDELCSERCKVCSVLVSFIEITSAKEDILGQEKVQIRVH